jgi:Na+/H+ antiporter NhaD/arsenite permease-like protein
MHFSFWSTFFCFVFMRPFGLRAQGNVMLCLAIIMPLIIEYLVSPVFASRPTSFQETLRDSLFFFVRESKKLTSQLHGTESFLRIY